MLILANKKKKRDSCNSSDFSIFVTAALKQNFSFQPKALLQFSLDYHQKILHINVMHGSSVISLETSGCLRANTEAFGATQ